jgi:hypothetical protein
LKFKVLLNVVDPLNVRAPVAVSVASLLKNELAWRLSTVSALAVDDRLNVVPLNERPVPAVYCVLVLDIVKLGYVPDIDVAPEPVKETVWSGAVFAKVVPVRLRPVPAV